MRYLAWFNLHKPDRTVVEFVATFLSDAVTAAEKTRGLVTVNLNGSKARLEVSDLT